jgi:hypothetical protein
VPHTLTRDDLVKQAYPLVAIEARRFTSLPPGLSIDDLESLGGELLLAFAAEYGGPEEDWRKVAKFHLRNRMRTFVSTGFKRSRRATTLEVITPTGEEFPRPDPRVADPAELAAVRERVTKPKRVGIRELAASLPAPEEVADRVTELRAAMFGAIMPDRIRSMMDTLQHRAVAGDLRAMKLLIDLLSPGRSGVTVQQQAVVIRTGDLD